MVWTAWWIVSDRRSDRGRRHWGSIRPASYERAAATTLCMSIQPICSACGRGCLGGLVGLRLSPPGLSGTGGGVRERANSATFSANSQATSTLFLAAVSATSSGATTTTLSSPLPTWADDPSIGMPSRGLGIIANSAWRVGGRSSSSTPAHAGAKALVLRTWTVCPLSARSKFRPHGYEVTGQRSQVLVIKYSQPRHPSVIERELLSAKGLS